MIVEPDEISDASFAYFKTLSYDEMYILIKKTAKKSCPSDPMPTPLILQLLDVLLPVITAMINLSLKNWSLC